MPDLEVGNRVFFCNTISTIVPFQKLEFTLTSKANGPSATAVPPAGATPSPSSISPEEISAQLRSMLSAGKNKPPKTLNEDIFNWIDVSLTHIQGDHGGQRLGFVADSALADAKWVEVAYNKVNKT